MKSVLKVRMSSHDAHYGGGLVDGAKMLQFFGDVATELLIMNVTLLFLIQLGKIFKEWKRD